MSNTATEFVAEAAKAAPPTAVVGLTLAGVTLNDWVLIGSGLLISLQIAFLLYEKLYKSRKVPK